MFIWMCMHESGRTRTQRNVWKRRSAQVPHRDDTLSLYFCTSLPFSRSSSTPPSLSLSLSLTLSFSLSLSLSLSPPTRRVVSHALYLEARRARIPRSYARSARIVQASQKYVTLVFISATGRRMMCLLSSWPRCVVRCKPVRAATSARCDLRRITLLLLVRSLNRNTSLYVFSNLHIWFNIEQI